MQNQSHTTVHARPDGKIAAEAKLSRTITSAQNRVLKHAADKRRRRRDIVLELPEGALDGTLGENTEAELGDHDAPDQWMAPDEDDYEGET
jgi:hypothetical protein